VTVEGSGREAAAPKSDRAWTRVPKPSPGVTSATAPLAGEVDSIDPRFRHRCSEKWAASAVKLLALVLGLGSSSATRGYVVGKPQRPNLRQVTDTQRPASPPVGPVFARRAARRRLVDASRHQQIVATGSLLRRWPPTAIRGPSYRHSAVTTSVDTPAAAPPQRGIGWCHINP
jgi:hypothetical protein